MFSRYEKCIVAETGTLTVVVPNMMIPENGTLKEILSQNFLILVVYMYEAVLISYRKELYYFAYSNILPHIEIHNRLTNTAS